MRENQVNQKYLLELFGFLFIYVVMNGITWYAKDMPDSTMRTALALLPMLPALGMLWAIVRHFQRMDEYLRIWSLENLAIAGAMTWVFSLTYGFMEGVGYPLLSMWVVWSIFMGGYGLVACTRKFLGK